MNTHPIGLDLGGPTPQEIAVAILAEIVAVRRGKRIRQNNHQSIHMKGNQNYHE